MARFEPKFTLVFAMGSAATAVLSAGFVPLAWPALSFGVVGLAYAGLGARPFLKGAHGKRNPIATIVLAPYLALAWLVLLALRLRDEPAYHEIRPRLFLGRKPLRASELPKDVALVVDLTSEFPRLHPKDVEYICLPTLDGSAPHDLAAARALIDRIAAHEGAVYVHCAAGHGRSAALVASVLVIEKRAASVREALAIIRAVRPGAGLSKSQRAFVREVADFEAKDAVSFTR
jgi:protein-tyrosine phosphatase